MNSTKETKEVYFHIGLGKVASTYLQYEVFSKLRNIKYIQRTQYKKSPTIIKNASENKFLISREFDRLKYIEREAKWFSGHFPDAKPILILRRHDSWIASQYRRYAKNGYPWNFDDFFDIDNDQGQWKQEDLAFYKKITVLEEHFQHKPLVLFYDDMLKDPVSFIDRIAKFLKADYDPSKISLSRKHISYNEKQMKASIAVGKRINIQPHIRLNSKIADKVRHLFIAAVRYTTLYSALLLPGSVFKNKELIPSGQLEKIRAAYSNDWDKCLQYAHNNNPV